MLKFSLVPFGQMAEVEMTIESGLFLGSPEIVRINIAVMPDRCRGFDLVLPAGLFTEHALGSMRGE